MNPLEHYEHAAKQSGFIVDPHQQHVVQQLNAVYYNLVAHQQKTQHFLWPIRQYLPRKPVKGVYLWGGVGRGKTFLMDGFFDCLPFKQKLRLHFHRFMWRVHDELRRRQGQKNPLPRIAKQLSREAQILCFDEFFVSDVTDAMLLAGLFQALFQQGICLVATSNIPPDELYKNGVQRQNFLPAIDCIKQHTSVLALDSPTDYRLRALEAAELYHHPADAKATQQLADYFTRLAPTTSVDNTDIIINRRPIPVLKQADDVIWCDFSDLCASARSASDYIEMSRLYHSILLSNIPQMQAKDDAAARRFINLIDECYDHNVKIIATADVPIDKLYQGSQLTFEFKRTQSRLLEMQSQDYLGRAHRP